MENTIIKDLVKFINENQNKQITEVQVIKELLKYDNDYYVVEDVDAQLKHDLSNLVAKYIDFEDFRFDNHMRKNDFKEEIADNVDEYYNKLHNFIMNSDLFKENDIDSRSVMYYDVKDMFIYSNKEIGDNTFFEENSEYFKNMLSEKDKLIILNEDIANKLGYEESIEELKEVMRDFTYVSGGERDSDFEVLENVDELINHMQLEHCNGFKITIDTKTNNLICETSYANSEIIKPLSEEGLEFYDNVMSEFENLENYSFYVNNQLDKHDIAKILYNTPKYSNEINADEKMIAKESEIVNKFFTQILEFDNIYSNYRKDVFEDYLSNDVDDFEYTLDVRDVLTDNNYTYTITYNSITEELTQFVESLNISGEITEKVPLTEMIKTLKELDEPYPCDLDFELLDEVIAARDLDLYPDLEQVELSNNELRINSGKYSR